MLHGAVMTVEILRFAQNDRLRSKFKRAGPANTVGTRTARKMPALQKKIQKRRPEASGTKDNGNGLRSSRP
jgi:hypothetical protein